MVGWRHVGVEKGNKLCSDGYHITTLLWCSKSETVASLMDNILVNLHCTISSSITFIVRWLELYIVSQPNCFIKLHQFLPALIFYALVNGGKLPIHLLHHLIYLRYHLHWSLDLYANVHLILNMSYLICTTLYKIKKQLSTMKAQWNQENR